MKIKKIENSTSSVRRHADVLNDDAHAGDDMGENELLRVESHDTTPPDGYAITADGAVKADEPTVERTGADIVADLLASKVRIDCERARWDALADELGKRAKSNGQTRVPVRIGGTVYKLKLTDATKVYSLNEAAEPGEIK